MGKTQLIIPRAPRSVYDPRAHYASTLVGLLNDRFAAGVTDYALMDKIESILWPEARAGEFPPHTQAQTFEWPAG